MTRARHLFRIAGAILVFLAMLPAAGAFEPIRISKGDVALDLTDAVEVFTDQGSSFQVNTAPQPDGIVRRIEVDAQDENATGVWAVFALANATSEQIDRLIVAPHFRLPGSGLLYPDLGSPRITAITPSEGFALDRVPSEDSDIFQVTLNPGTVVTFVMELASPRLPKVYLWDTESYKDTVNSYTLYRGIVIGIAGLLALFLTILFVIKGTSMFPATAALAWAALAFISIDFGFLNRIIEITPGNIQMWRAATEVSLAATFVIFLFTYLNLNRWHDHFSYGALIWITALGLLAAVAIIDPPLSAGIARISFLLTAIAGAGLIVVLGSRGYDRAIMLVPGWLMLAVWLTGAWMTVTGMLDNDIVQPALSGGLILITLLIGFTVMQHAFSGGGVQQGLFSDVERQALAVTGSGDLVWDWDVLRDRVVTRPDLSHAIGLAANALHGPARNWLPVLHPEDRDLFRSTLDTIVEQRRGRIAQALRLRAADGQYHWYLLRARPVIGSDGEIIRCVGTLIDVTEQKNSEERLMHDAVHDNLTGLPNRQLFLDRLESVLAIAGAEERLRPTVFAIDIDRFKLVNDEFGMSAGDTILLTIARRMHRLLQPHDTLSRISGDQFGLILLSESEAPEIAKFAESLRRAISAPIAFGKSELMLTSSIGLITATSERSTAVEMLKDAELAMHQAKRQGGDRIEPFRPAFRALSANRLQLEADLRRAIERSEFGLSYQPIVRLEDRSIAGFEALIHWDHPRRGVIPPSEFIPSAETTGLILALAQFAMQKATADLQDWQNSVGGVPLSVSVNLSSEQVIRQDLITEIKTVLSHSGLKPRWFRLELAESLVMRNPEQSAHVLQRLRQLGIGLSLDGFGTGFSSLSYLTRFPFDTIKLDRGFIEDRSPKKYVLLKSIVNMAHDLGLSVVCEGVATEEDVEILREMGCEYAQSTMLGAPLNSDEVLRLLQESFVVP